MTPHQWIREKGDSIVTIWCCPRCEYKVRTPNHSDDSPQYPTISDLKYDKVNRLTRARISIPITREDIPEDCDEAVVKSVIYE